MPRSARRATRLAVALAAVLLLALAGCEQLPQAPVAQAVPTRPPMTPVATVPSPARPTSSAIIGQLRIPSVGIDVPLVSTSWRLEHRDGQPVAVWQAAEGAAGHHVGTARPGQSGNCVISAHSGTPATAEPVEGLETARSAEAPFATLDQVAPGAEIVITDARGAAHTYRVTGVSTLPDVGAPLAERLAYGAAMDPTEDDRLTLITCWPAWGYTHRLVVTAKLGP